MLSNLIRYGTVRRVLACRQFVPLCLLTSLALKLVWVGLVDAQPVSDFQWYYDRAREFAANCGYSVGGHPTAYWPVGYPAFLGLLIYLCGDSLLLLKLANIPFHIAAEYSIYLISKRTFDSEPAARITLALFAFLPNHIAYSSLLSSENLFLFLLLLGVLSLMGPDLRLWKAVAVGVLLGLGCLVKPQMLFVPAVVFLVGIRRADEWPRLWRRVGSYAAVYIGLALVVAPYVIRNAIVFGYFPIMVTNSGVNLLIGSNPQANGTYVNVAPMIEYEADEFRRDRLARDLARDYALSHPLRIVGLLPLKFWHLYATDVEGITWNLVGLGVTPAKLKQGLKVFMGMAQLYYMILWGLFAYFIILYFVRGRLRRPGHWRPELGLALMLYFTLIYLIYFGGGRFHFPMTPWMAVYGGALLGIGRTNPTTTEVSDCGRFDTSGAGQGCDGGVDGEF